ncbi:NB-ARC domain-containing protein [Streptosporangium sandarakinum]|uniref:NB-ARC domain-containing protein n=1 Tax=Streptosporangium sandarakinum TaxID=1260955 RepID=UPI0033B452CB
MARRKKRAVGVATGTLTVLTIAVGLPINVVSDYFPEWVTGFRGAWVAGLVVATLGVVLLTWLIPRLAERRPRKALFQVQPMPRGWVPRDELDAVVRALTGAGRGTIGPTSTTAALTGAGGFGKTSLAVAACHDRRVRKYFSGGIVWAAIGQDRSGADVAELIRGICEGLSEERPQMTDLEQLSHHLSDLLAERGRVLLVVDDVWTSAQLDPFLTVAQRSHLLVTTRRSRILSDGAVIIAVDAMVRAAAARLLGRNLPAMRLSLQHVLLELTGGWPLLLALVNSRLVEDVRRGADVNAAAEQAFARLRQAGPAALDITDSGQRGTAVKATVHYSLDVLDSHKRERFLELGIFPEDVIIPIDVVALAWRGTANLTTEQTQRICEELAGLSLISIQWIDGRKPALTLHDVLRSFIRSEDGLGVQRRAEVNRAMLAEAHSLFASKAGEQGNVAWWELPLGHFLWDNLAYHLSEGGCRRELDALVSDIRWVLARLHHSGAWALEGDLAYSSSLQSMEIRRLIARIGYLLGDLESEELSRRNRLSVLSSHPYFRDQIERLFCPREPVLLPMLPMPSNLDSALRRTLGGHADAVSAVAIAPDGTWLASGSNDKTVRLWTAEGSQRAVLRGHTSWVGAVAIAPDGTWLASGADDRTVRLWNADGTERAILNGHSDCVDAIAIAPDGTWLASGSKDGTIRLWSLDGTERAVLRGHAGPVRAVAIAPDGTWLASSSQDRTVRIWGAEGVQRAVLTDHTGVVFGVAIAPDGTWLASASEDYTLQTWNTDGTELAVFTGHIGWVRAVAIAPDGTWLASGADDGTVRLWNADGTERAILTGHVGPVSQVAFAPDGTWLAAACEDGTVRLWSVDGTERPVISHSFKADGVALAPDGTWMASGCEDGMVRLWNADGTERAVLAGHKAWVNHVDIATDGTWLASASQDGTVRLWNSDGTVRAVLTGHKSWVNAVDIAPDGTWLASVSDDMTVRLWNADGTERAILNGHEDWVNSVAIAPDGNWLVTGSRDGSVRLWDIDGYEERAVLLGHSSAVYEVTVAPDGIWLASASGDGTVRLWNVDGTERAVLSGHSGQAYGVAVAPDGTWLATSDDQMIRIWTTDGVYRCIAALRYGAHVIAIRWHASNIIIGGGLYGIYMLKPSIPARANQKGGGF